LELFDDADRARWAAQLGYDSIRPFSIEESLAPARIGAIIFFIDRTGRRAFPRGFEQTYGFSEGFASVCDQGKWFFIDRNGTDLFADRFDEVTNFSRSLASVREGTSWFVIDTTGTRLNEDPFERVWIDGAGRIRAVVKGVNRLFDAVTRSLR